MPHPLVAYRLHGRQMSLDASRVEAEFWMMADRNPEGEPGHPVSLSGMVGAPRQESPRRAAAFRPGMAAEAPRIWDAGNLRRISPRWDGTSWTTGSESAGCACLELVAGTAPFVEK